MKKILLAAFNKDIARELASRLGIRNPDRPWAVQQRAIFDFFKTLPRHLVVPALAGTGKTTTIIEAITYIQDGEAEAKTLHSLGNGFIRRQWSNVRTDEEAQQVDMDRARAACGQSAPDDIVYGVKKLASLCKNCLPLSDDVGEVVELAVKYDLEPDEEWEEEGWTVERVAKLALAARDAAKVRDSQGRVSYDDMIYLPLALRLARAWYDVVVIDEAQDMNAAQIMLARAACKKTGRIVVVGDSNQAIYGFRGADSGSLERLRIELDAAVLPLTVTYRCGKSIVARAAAIVPGFTAAPSAPDGIVDSLDEEKLFETAKPGDFVLCRRNAPLMSTCLGFLKRGVRARVQGRDVVKGLKLAVSKLRAKSVPDFIERVGGWLKKEISRAEKVTGEDARAAKIERLTDQAETLTALAEGCASIAEIGMRVETLFGDHGKDGPPHVVCSSVHRAKGLEADRVFILTETKKRPAKDAQEERNIEYVANTRARLHLTIVPLRGRDGKAAVDTASPVTPSSTSFAPRAASRHIGTVGKRETFKGLVVERIFASDGQWGTTHIHQMRDQSGNVFKWFSTSGKLDAGQAYDIKGTVKSHETFRGEAQTVITRCAATKVAAASKVAS